MGVTYNTGPYTSISQIKGPSGWYWINTSMGPVHTYINQEYDGGGWALVMANCGGTGGMNNLTYDNAVNNCNFRSSNTSVTMGSKLGSLANYNVWIGTKFWKELAGRKTANKVTVVQFVAGTNGTALNGSHTKRYRWQFDGFNSTYGMTGVSAVSDETGTGSLVFSNSPVLTTPNIGTPSAGTLTSCTGLPLTTGVTGTLPVANGGTGVTTSTGSGNVVLSASPTLTGTLSAAAGSFSSTLASGALTVTGAITATTSITSYYSDDRLKDKLGRIQGALDKLCSLEGFYFKPNQTAQDLGYTDLTAQVGVSAQSVQAVLPEVIQPAPIDPQYLTVDYARMVPLIIEAIKELREEFKSLK